MTAAEAFERARRQVDDLERVAANRNLQRLTPQRYANYVAGVVAATDAYFKENP